MSPFWMLKGRIAYHPGADPARLKREEADRRRERRKTREQRAAALSAQEAPVSDNLPALREPSVLSRTVPASLARYRGRAQGREFALGGTSARLAALVGLSLLVAGGLWLLVAVVQAAWALHLPR